MHHYVYATRRDVKFVKKQIIELVHQVQDDLRDCFTFDYRFAGSEELKLVTYDPTTNIGFDLDVNIYVNNQERQYIAKELRTILIESFNKFVKKYGFDYCENNSRAFTIKVKDHKNSRIKHSCDFAIVNNYLDEHDNLRQEIIVYDKNDRSYHWQEQPHEYYLQKAKIEDIKSIGHWEDVRKLYLDKKNNNPQDKSSRSLRAEAIDEIHQKYFY